MVSDMPRVHSARSSLNRAAIRSRTGLSTLAGLAFFVLISVKRHPSLFASASPSFIVTCRPNGRSALFPISSTGSCVSGRTVSNLARMRSASSKEALDQTLYIRTNACAVDSAYRPSCYVLAQLRPRTSLEHMSMNWLPRCVFYFHDERNSADRDYPLLHGCL